MSAALRVSLTPALKGAPQPARWPVLDGCGPRVCIGATGANAEGLAVPVRPDALSLFGPRGACLSGSGRQLWVNDTGHHRLLGWQRLPDQDGIPADWVIGQCDFEHEGRNGKAEPGATTLNVPTGITGCGAGLAVADAWNHRVLLWWNAPEGSNAPADLVLGQPDFATVEANRGHPEPSASSLFWPYGVHWDGTNLWVSDTGNRRVLMWHGLPQRSGQAADLVLGQAGFACRDENGGSEPSARSMRWPHGVSLWQGRLCVADAGNNRIMIWDTPPATSNAPCDHLLGQNDSVKVDHNQSLYWPTPATLNMPYGIASAGPWLIAADTASSRLLAWHAADCRTGAAACALTGQTDFHAKGDNRWQAPVRDSLCWPYGVMHHDGLVAVADSGNNRVLLWRLADQLDDARVCA